MIKNNSKRLIQASLKNLLDRCETYENLIKQIHAHSIIFGFFTQNGNSDQFFACKLLNVYVKLNKPAVAQKVFDQISVPDIVSWTSLINLYLKTQQPSKALSVFSQCLSSSSLRPDAHCVLAALSACSRMKNLDSGKAVHAMVYRFLSKKETIVDNALIDMYSRVAKTHLARRVFDCMQDRDVSTWTSLLNGFIVCGDIDAARKVFDDMPSRNVVSWTAMIVGYVRVKIPIEALKLFRTMQAEGQDSPTTITIVAVLSGCADIGALDSGKCIHGFVNKLTGLTTDVAVNNGLIDMYAKSGDLQSAKVIFNNMVNKDLFSWTSIISGLAYNGRGKDALEHFYVMVASGMTPNEVTFLSVLSACAHAGLVDEGQRFFMKMRNSPSYEPKLEHYGCMVDLLGRAGFFEEVIRLIEDMPLKPDAVIWRSLLSACLGHNNLDLAEMAGKKVLELEPEDDGVCILLWNLYRRKKMWKDASRVGKMMRDQSIKKKPGCSWVEVNGVVHEFLAETQSLPVYGDAHIVLEGITRESELITGLDSFEDEL
ncbi:OLC1v1002226C1 [Oldenlandia corymbosa var. corymbosa]|uniref:OLC1v1002226C1 n=1 Tax=Oldenlandia corymbosa var. corymbosa TaxID=529605 RepID=A0AAV1D9H2_OLDCO|nr:OLC1v1002226C1 [Oldenlandia corymbosa var. corymbosa]